MKLPSASEITSMALRMTFSKLQNSIKKGSGTAKDVLMKMTNIRDTIESEKKNLETLEDSDSREGRLIRKRIIFLYRQLENCEYLAEGMTKGIAKTLEALQKEQIEVRFLIKESLEKGAHSPQKLFEHRDKIDRSIEEILLRHEKQVIHSKANLSSEPRTRQELILLGDFLRKEMVNASNTLAQKRRLQEYLSVIKKKMKALYQTSPSYKHFSVANNVKRTSMYSKIAVRHKQLPKLVKYPGIVPEQYEVPDMPGSDRLKKINALRKMLEREDLPENVIKIRKTLKKLYDRRKDEL